MKRDEKEDAALEKMRHMGKEMEDEVRREDAALEKIGHGKHAASSSRLTSSSVSFPMPHLL